MPSSSELVENARQVGLDFPFVVEDVGENHVERARYLAEVTRSQLHGWREIVSIQLESRVFQSRQSAREGFVAFRRRANLGELSELRRTGGRIPARSENRGHS